MDKGILIVFSAPSGCGKGTVLKELLAQDPNLFYSVSATTRRPRPGEQEGVNYYFLSNAQFEQEIAAGGMLEHARYVDHYYGTPKKAVCDQLDCGRDVILEIEVQGALQVKERFPEAVMIFLLPPSVETLRSRLLGRGTEAPETVEQRLAAAKTEMAAAGQYDYLVVNDDLSQAVSDVQAVIRAEKLRLMRQRGILSHLLGE